MAFKWFKVAANKGNSKAQFALSRCYARGFGTKKDINQSMYYLKKAAEQNEPNALTILGHCYIMGYNVCKDVNKGVILLKEAM